MECYACGDKSHMAADCDLRLPATNDVEHMARIRRLVDAWVEGRITTQRKRQLVAGENRSYYGENCKPALTNLAFTKETA